MAKMLKVKIARYLKTLGAKGIKRMHLMQHFNCRADELDRAIPLLLADGAIVAWKHTSRGRPATVYYDAEAVKDLTPPEEPATAIADETLELPARCTYCKTCGRAIAIPAVGRPYVYCSHSCRRGGLAMQAFLAPALSDPRIFSSVAVLLVMADILMRGFSVARDAFIAGPRILVTDHEIGRYLDVVPIGLDGRFPDPQDYEAMAGVYQDGRIVYGGRACFIETASPASEDAAAEESVGPSEVDGEEPAVEEGQAPVDERDAAAQERAREFLEEP
jgi:hypothetical protein